MTGSQLLCLLNESRQVFHFILNCCLHVGGLMAHNYIDSFWVERTRSSTNVNDQGQTTNFMEHLCAPGFHSGPESGCKDKHIERLVDLVGLQKRALLHGLCGDRWLRTSLLSAREHYTRQE